ncbi:MAG: hypothetical protein WHT29_08415 [Bacteroidales bacterium]|nr:hypothetical protein [Bacteroidales bacterium]HOK99839.1 hypothetical protein [Bacteroidales bacterium]HPO66636.1 hypothetical protein [Bacteroidales bacterium]
MVNVKKYFAYHFVFTAFLAGILLSRCNNKTTDEYFYCINCIAEHPDSERIKIKLTINAENQRVPIHIFASKFNPYQTNDTVYSDTLTEGEVTIKVATDKFYSVVAYYKSGNDTIMAIDGGLFETKKIAGCQNTCWQINGGIYDVRLKKY